MSALLSASVRYNNCSINYFMWCPNAWILIMCCALFRYSPLGLVNYWNAVLFNEMHISLMGSYVHEFFSLSWVCLPSNIQLVLETHPWLSCVNSPSSIATQDSCNWRERWCWSHSRVSFTVVAPVSAVCWLTANVDASLRIRSALAVKCSLVKPFAFSLFRDEVTQISTSNPVCSRTQNLNNVLQWLKASELRVNCFFLFWIFIPKW